MLGVALFGIFFTPAFYAVIRRLTGRGMAASVPTCVPVWADCPAAGPPGEGAGQPAAATPAFSATAIQSKPRDHEV